MATETFFVKFGDTRSALVATLFNPDDTAFDLTGQTAINLNVKLDDGTVIQRTGVTVVGDPKQGKVSYQSAYLSRWRGRMKVHLD